MSASGLDGGCCDAGVDAEVEEARLTSAAARPLDLDPLPPPNMADEDEVTAQLGTLPAGIVVAEA